MKRTFDKNGCSQMNRFVVLFLPNGYQVTTAALVSLNDSTEGFFVVASHFTFKNGRCVLLKMIFRNLNMKGHLITLFHPFHVWDIHELWSESDKVSSAHIFLRQVAYFGNFCLIFQFLGQHLGPTAKSVNCWWCNYATLSVYN